jgi:hypothetical protein
MIHSHAGLTKPPKTAGTETTKRSLETIIHPSALNRVLDSTRQGWVKRKVVKLNATIDPFVRTISGNIGKKSRKKCSDVGAVGSLYWIFFGSRPPLSGALQLPARN